MGGTGLVLPGPELLAWWPEPTVLSAAGRQVLVCPMYLDAPWGVNGLQLLGQRPPVLVCWPGSTARSAARGSLLVGLTYLKASWGVNAVRFSGQRLTVLICPWGLTVRSAVGRHALVCRPYRVLAHWTMVAHGHHRCGQSARECRRRRDRWSMGVVDAFCHGHDKYWTMPPSARHAEGMGRLLMPYHPWWLSAHDVVRTCVCLHLWFWCQKGCLVLSRLVTCAAALLSG